MKLGTGAAVSAAGAVCRLLGTSVSKNASFMNDKELIVVAARSFFVRRVARIIRSLRLFFFFMFYDLFLLIFF